MSTTDPNAPDESGADLTAAEYVLGVLPANERAAAAARAIRDRAFAAEIVEWEERLTPLAAHVEPSFPRASVWPAIAAQLTPDRRAKPRVEAAPPFWERLVVWRSIAGIAALAAVLVLVVAAILPSAPVVAPPAPPAGPLIVSVARLEAPSGGVAFVATLDESKGEMLITPTGAAADSGHSPELWLMPQGAPPTSLGVFIGRQTLVVRAPPGLTNGAELGVSMEPLGGSPTGQPTGPVVAQGRLMRL